MRKKANTCDEKITELEKLLYETIQMAEDSEISRQQLEDQLEETRSQLSSIKFDNFQLRQKSLETSLSEKDAQIALYELNRKTADTAKTTTMMMAGTSSAVAAATTYNDSNEQLEQLKLEREWLIKEIQQVANQSSSSV